MYIKWQDVQHTISLKGGVFRRVGGGGAVGGRIQVNSERVSLEALAGAGEPLCGPDIGRALVPPLRCQIRGEL